ncbi:MAG: NADP-dependent oxidoreductase [Actinomycetota bacterium]|nr:NADP-dependent oxidoreductase [Actinomycetota bacterium]
MPKVFRFTEYGGAETQEFVDLPAPEPGPSEILVKVHAAGVNPVDYKIRRGMLASFSPRELPSEFGSEVSGVVVKFGQDVDGFAPGDEVFGSPAPTHGAFSEYTVTSAEATAKKPPQVSFTDAAAIPVAGATGYDGIVHLNLSEGQTLLINGIGGGVGVVAAQIARDSGIAVFGTASESKRALVESLGAILVPYGDGVEGRVRELLPDGVDGIYDLVGGDALRSVAGLVKDRSKLISAADPTTATELGGAPVKRDRTARILDEVAQLVADGKLDPHVNDVVAFDDAPQAVASVESGHALGKVVLQLL